LGVRKKPFLAESDCSAAVAGTAAGAGASPGCPPSQGEVSAVSVVCWVSTGESSVGWGAGAVAAVSTL